MEPIENLIVDLLKAENIRREFDDRIAEQIGWQRVYKQEIDSNGTSVTKQLGKWYPPNSMTLTRVPDYTRDIGSAYELAVDIAKGRRIGFAWESNRASAVIGSARIIEARTPAVALCIAALVAYRGEISQVPAQNQDASSSLA